MSRTAEYAVRAMSALHALSTNGLVGVRALSGACGVPANYLSKIMHTLGRAGMVDSVRGPSGGFRLMRSAHRLTAYDIVCLFDDLEGQRRCFLGNKTCNAAHACAAHQMWSAVWDRYEKFLRGMTLDRLRPRALNSTRRRRKRPS